MKNSSGRKKLKNKGLKEIYFTLLNLFRMTILCRLLVGDAHPTTPCYTWEFVGWASPTNDLLRIKKCEIFLSLPEECPIIIYSNLNVTIQRVAVKIYYFQKHVIPECSYRESSHIPNGFPITTLGNDGFHEVLIEKTQNPVSVKLR